MLASIIYSSLLSAPQDNIGWKRPEYILSRFVGDCALAAGFDAIKYPSTRSSLGYNLVISKKVGLNEITTI